MSCSRSDALAPMALALLSAFSAASCTTDFPPRSVSATPPCLAVTVGQLSDDPSRFGGRRVCVTGYLGRMVPEREGGLSLYAARQEAEAAQGPRFVELDLRPAWLRSLSGLSPQRVQVEGMFEFDAGCWPRARPEPAACSSSRPALVRVELFAFPDGVR